MGSNRTVFRQQLSRAALGVLITLIFAGLAVAIVTLPPSAAGIAAEVDTNLADTGVSNPARARIHVIKWENEGF